MSHLWIVHRDAQARAALTRLAGEERPLVGEPTHPQFEVAEAPELVLLGLSGDFEAELEFAHRVRNRFRAARWILLPPPADVEEVRHLFDTLSAELLPYPPNAARLRRSLRALRSGRENDSLSRRQFRDRLATRFARWFADLELSELLRMLDPRLADVAILVRGEVGCGRSLLARYVHLFGSRPSGAFASVCCTPELRSSDLLEALARAVAEQRSEGEGGLTVCLEELDRLALREQRSVRDWVELGFPRGIAPIASVRWIATVGEPAGLEERELDLELEEALAGLSVRIPPLRERSEAIGAFARATVLAWCQERAERRRVIGPDAIASLQEHPWPGNLRELEAVIVRSLASQSTDPLTAKDLRFEVGAAVVSVLSTPTPLPVGEPVAREEGLAPQVDLDRFPEEGEVEPEAAPSETKPPAEEVERLVEPAPMETPPFDGAPPEPVELPASPESPNAALRRLASAVAGEMREPTTGLLRLAELLPARAEDADFRAQLSQNLEEGAGRISALVDRLSRFGALAASAPGRVHLAELLDQILERRRAAIQRRRLLVLKELDREEPYAWVDREQLRFAVEGLLDSALSRVPERGDLYLASKHHASSPGGKASVRVLLRFQSSGPAAEWAPGAEGNLALAIAEAVVRAQGGTLTVDASVAEETLVLFDLPASP